MVNIQRNNKQIIMLKQIKNKLEFVILDKTNRKIIIAFLLCLLTMGLFSNTYLQKEKEYQNQLSDIQTRYETLQVNNANLIEKHNELKASYNKLSSDYKNLEEEIENYKDQIATINDQNEKLKELHSQYDILQSDRDNLQKQLDAKKAEQERIAREQEAQMQLHSYGMVYWTTSGECYHSTPNCPTLKRSKNIQSGSIAGSSRRPCKVCY